MNVAPYAKFVVAVLGAGITASLGVVAPDTDIWRVLTILAAVVTAAGVYITPNATTPDDEPRHLAE